MKPQKTKFKETEIGTIPEEWEILPVSEVARVNEKVLSKNDKFEQIQYLDTASVNEGEISKPQPMSLNEAPSRAKRLLRSQDTVISTVRPNLKHYAFIQRADPNLIGSTGFAVVTPKEIDSRFLYYSLTTDSVTDYFSSIAASQTSAYPAMNPEAVENLLIGIPSRNEQSRIASILSSLDDKIELNRKINENLEKIASALFKRWFVDFEFPNEKGQPYKSSGGKMVESELGEIPEGWGVRCLSDAIEESTSGDWGKEQPEEGFANEVLCIRGTDIAELKEGRMGKMPKRFIKDISFKNKALRSGDIVFEISGGSPTQSTGRCVLITEELLTRYEAPLICSNFCRVVRFKDLKKVGYFYVLLNKLYSRGDFFQFENGTSGIKNLNLDALLDTSCFAMDDRCVDAFTRIFDCCYRDMQKAGKTSYGLSEVRDSLLPRFMSGRIRV
jgi:type I restriction enzyme S subunit